MNETAKVLERLRAYEARNVTFMTPDGAWPIVWERAQGTQVWDAEGRVYLDLTAAFGVAAAGHGNRAVVKAGQKQMATLLHAMGDVHPHARKAELAEKLSQLTFERWGAGTARSLFGCAGFEAVEAALKTAALATQKRGVIVFEGGYHGLGYGALNATHRDYFRAPFKSQLREFGCFATFPQKPEDMARVEFEIRHWFRRERIGAILVEPVQARGGCRVPPPGFLPLLRKLCDEAGALLILDEIYTGFGRTGRWFACEHAGVAPDVICLGKALTGGFPLSACVGRGPVMDAAWPASTGEALHTSTYLGHPVGCAMALAQIAQIEKLRLVERSAELGAFLVEELQALAGRLERWQCHGRGLGLMAGLEIHHADGTPDGPTALAAIQALLRRGCLFLPEGEHGQVISFTPPLTISGEELTRAIETLEAVLQTA